MTEPRQVWQAKKNGRGGWEAENRVTGEVVKLAPTEGMAGWREQHIWLFQDMIRQLAEENWMGREQTRVFLYLLGVLEWDNWLVVPQRTLMEALGLKQANVSRALRGLLEHGVLLQAQPPAPRTAYRFNSTFAYKGKYQALRKRRREEMTKHEYVSVRMEQQALKP